MTTRYHGGIAQLVEQLLSTQQVGCSSHPVSTESIGSLAQHGPAHHIVNVGVTGSNPVRSANKFKPP